MVVKRTVRSTAVAKRSTSPTKINSNEPSTVDLEAEVREIIRLEDEGGVASVVLAQAVVDLDDAYQAFDRNRWEAAYHYWVAVKMKGSTQAALAKAVGKSANHVSIMVRLWEKYSDKSERLIEAAEQGASFTDYYALAQVPEKKRLTASGKPVAKPPLKLVPPTPADDAFHAPGDEERPGLVIPAGGLIPVAPPCMVESPEDEEEYTDDMRLSDEVDPTMWRGQRLTYKVDRWAEEVMAQETISEGDWITTVSDINHMVAALSKLSENMPLIRQSDRGVSAEATGSGVGIQFRGGQGSSPP
jgi:hypothetical protein